eukprot:1645127-Rhodomonas_salina.1
MEMGYDGKTLIHPSQVPAILGHGGNSAVQVEFSQRVIEAHAKAVLPPSLRLSVPPSLRPSVPSSLRPSVPSSLRPSF